jgi:hypothetical protein
MLSDRVWPDWMRGKGGSGNLLKLTELKKHNKILLLRITNFGVLDSGYNSYNRVRPSQQQPIQAILRQDTVDVRSQLGERGPVLVVDGAGQMVIQ